MKGNNREKEEKGAFYPFVSKEGFVFLKLSVTIKDYKAQQVWQVRIAVSEESLNYHSGKTCRNL